MEGDGALSSAGDIAVVEEFIAGWGPGRDRLVATFKRCFTPRIEWENVGLVTTYGIAEAIAILDAFPLAFDYISADVLHIAAAAESVLTERIDHFHAVDGTVLASLRICGVFDLEHDRIARWRDYFDTAPWVVGIDT